MVQIPETANEIRLASRPHGWPTEQNFEHAEIPMPVPGDGQVLVRNLWMSVDPYMRGRMNDAKSYVAPFTVGEALEGGAVGEVVQSTVDSLRPGDFVLHNFGWRDYAVLDAKFATKVDPALAPLSTYLGVLGTTGMSAYVGLFEIAKMVEGETVFVSGAAGAVGSSAGQLAKQFGAARVIGSAGSPEKVRYLVEELGFDAAFDYHDGPVYTQLKAAAPDGIDVYFDNVGGDHLEAALSLMNRNGRIAVCGAIANYNATELPPGPRTIGAVIPQRLTIRGFLVFDHNDRKDDFVRDVAPLVASGAVKYRETIVDGLANAPSAFIGMLRGENTGKMLVKIAE